jgi:hypothetical protein
MEHMGLATTGIKSLSVVRMISSTVERRWNHRNLTSNAWIVSRVEWDVQLTYSQLCRTFWGSIWIWIAILCFLSLSRQQQPYDPLRLMEYSLFHYRLYDSIVYKYSASF